MAPRRRVAVLAVGCSVLGVTDTALAQTGQPTGVASPDLRAVGATVVAGLALLAIGIRLLRAVRARRGE